MNHIVGSFANSDELIKGRAAQIGEVREHGGKKMKKTANGWIPVSESGKSDSPSPQDKKQQTEAAELNRLRSAYANVSKASLGSKIKKMEIRLTKEKREDKSKDPGDRRSIAHGDTERKIKKLKVIYKEK